MLTLKLTLLLALKSASRCSGIKNLDINYLTKSESKYCFNILKPTKTSKPGKPLPKIQLLLSYIKPHSPVKACPLSNWICEVLIYAGVDIKTFKSHAARSVSTSKAKSLGVSTKQILKWGRWSSNSTWQKFYNKEIVSHEETKFESILAL